MPDDNNNTSDFDRSDLPKLIEEAADTPVESETPVPILPTWINPTAIKAGKDFVSRHFFLVFFTHFISLILLLSYVPVRVVLLKTGKSHTVKLALTRYLSTLMHIKMWYEGDLTSTNNEAVKDVLKVRKIHSGVSSRLGRHCPNNSLGLQEYTPEPCQYFLDAKSSSLLNSVTNVFRSESEAGSNQNTRGSSTKGDNNNNSPILISQLDMIVTQYCFMGLLTTFPTKFGVSISSKKEMEGLQGFIHIWAVIGYLLGIQDRFNICYGDKSSLKKYILEEILLNDLATTNTETVVLWKALTDSMSTFVPCLSLHAALGYTLRNVLQIKISQMIIDDGTFYDKFCFKITVFLFMYCFPRFNVEPVFNSLLRLAIYITSLRLGFLKLVARTVSV